MPHHPSLDADIEAWAQRHSLIISKNWAGRRVSSAYLSNIDGECFQIWIEPNSDGRIGVHIDYVEGPREPEPTREWMVDDDRLRDALEEAYDQVISWMAPSARHGSRTENKPEFTPFEIALHRVLLAIVAALLIALSMLSLFASSPAYVAAAAAAFVGAFCLWLVYWLRP